MDKYSKISTSRNAELDFWKFFAMIIIVIHHSNKIFEKERIYFPHGSIYVEFFFIVSGFLMALSASKKPQGDLRSLGTETVAYIFRSIKRLMPYVVFGWIVTFISDLAYYGADKVFTKENFLGLPFSVLFLQVSGMPMTEVIETDWYLSAMFLSMAVLYPLLRYRNDLFTKLIAPILAISLYAIMINVDGHIVGYTGWYAFFRKGFFRGIAGMSLGCSAFAVSRWLRGKFMYKGIPFLLSLVSIGCMVGSAVIMYYEIDGEYQGAVVVLFYIAIAVIASRKASVNVIFQNSFSVKLGKLSMAVFLTHISLTRWLNLAIESSGALLDFRESELGPPVLTAAFVILSLILGALCIAVTEPIQKKLKDFLKKEKQRQSAAE